MISFLWHQLALASCEFYVETIFWMDIYIRKISFIFIFPLFLRFSNMILSDSLILPVSLLSQLQTQQVMTSHIRSHIEYLIQTCHIFVLIL